MSSGKVGCLECGHQAAKLYRHLEAKHGLSAKEYKAKWGPQAKLRSDATTQRQRIKTTLRKDAARTPPKETKTIVCPSCKERHAVSKWLGTKHDQRCPSCKRQAADDLWAGKTEPEDYVSCLECGYKAENLTGHIQSAHPTYRELQPDALVVATGSAVRDKTALKGRTLSDETRALMSENAGRWNKGLTKEEHPSLARAAEKMREKTPWNRGLTVAEDERLQGAVEKLKTYVGENRPWSNGLKADLTLDDFAPVLDESGCVDRKKAVELLGVSWRTIYTYMQNYGLESSDVNIKARAEAQYIRLTEEDLAPYRFKNGKLSVGWAAARLGHDWQVVAREADRLGIPRLSRIKQGVCLGAISEALGGASWDEEWKDHRFKNPKTGWRYKFDGFFEEFKLVVEFHGYQHFVFPNAFHKFDEEAYLAQRDRDKHKADLIRGTRDLTYFLVRYDEDYTNPDYLKGRLVEAGVLKGGQSSTLELFAGGF